MLILSFEDHSRSIFAFDAWSSSWADQMWHCIDPWLCLQVEVWFPFHQMGDDQSWKEVLLENLVHHLLVGWYPLPTTLPLSPESIILHPVSVLLLSPGAAFVVPLLFSFFHILLPVSFSWQTILYPFPRSYNICLRGYLFFLLYMHILSWWILGWTNLHS